jgi:hypothetical protein
MGRLSRPLFTPFALLALAGTASQAPAADSQPAPWTVQVQAPDASPLPGATVTLLGLKGETVHGSAETDASGTAALQPPSPGSFLIRVKKGGFRTQSQAFLASPAGTTLPPIVFKLERGGADPD